MGKTLAEKILSQKSRQEAHAGDIVIARVDVAAFQDGTGPLGVRQLQKMNIEKKCHHQQYQSIIMFSEFFYIMF